MTTPARRILVSVDASSTGTTAVALAVELARAFGGTIVGLFVEDINVVRMAALPSARVFGRWTTEARAVDATTMERELRVAGERARRELARMAGATHVQSEFRVVRGAVPAVIVEQAAGFALMVVGKGSAPTRYRQALGSTAEQVMVEASAPVLLVREGEQLGRPIVVVDDGFGESGLDWVVDIASRHGGALLLGGPRAEVRVDEAAAALRARGVAVDVRRVADPPAGLVAELERAHAATVVLSATTLVAEPSILRVLPRLRVPILVVR